jgi:hypothetical protein
LTGLVAAYAATGLIAKPVLTFWRPFSIVAPAGRISCDGGHVRLCALRKNVKFAARPACAPSGAIEEQKDRCLAGFLKRFGAQRQEIGT